MFESFNNSLKAVVITVIATLSYGAVAQSPAEVENQSYFLCKNQKEVRTIRVQVEAGVCTTFYSKLGNEKNVGSGKNNESCVNFLNNIKTNLEKSNWNCRDISATRITASVE